MKKSAAVLLFALGAAVGYMFHAVPVDAQPVNQWSPFDAGQAAKLTVLLPEGVITCRVAAIQHGFIACAGDAQHQPRWINIDRIQVMSPIDR